MQTSSSNFQKIFLEKDRMKLRELRIYWLNFKIKVVKVDSNLIDNLSCKLKNVKWYSH